MKKSVIFTILFCLLCIGTIQALTLEGSGASFPYPLYRKMFSDYQKKTGVKILYDSKGSSDGILDLKLKRVDFAGTDYFLTDNNLKYIPEVVHIPICMGAVVFSYNLPGNPKLKLTQQVILDIYLGNIKYWNDPKITKVNPHYQFPRWRIKPLYRKDGSGSTFIFSYYLSYFSPYWRKHIGFGSNLYFPRGIGCQGNIGIARRVKKIKGSIGYIEQLHAVHNRLPIASVQNHFGSYVDPTLKSIQAAGGKATVPDDTRAILTNSKASNCYPLTGLTWVIVYKDQFYKERSKKRAQELVNALRWMIHDGQSLTKKNGYAPISRAMVKKADKLLDSIKYGHKQLEKL